MSNIEALALQHVLFDARHTAWRKRLALDIQVFNL